MREENKLMIEQFAKDVDEGLSQKKKTLSSKYFYNKRGDDLFIKIMKMPEYYLTRSEMEILSQQTLAIINAFQQQQTRHFELIELGAGDGTKTKKILARLSEENYQYDYIPIDISKNVLNVLAQSIEEDLPRVSIKPRHGDYFSILESLKNSHHPKIVLFLGSNIGNMSDDIAADFLYQLGANLKNNDKVLLGTDLIKPADVIMPAYNDKNGITRDFNLNLLHRMNIELDATFDMQKFEHAPEYDERDGIAKSFLRSKQDQKVAINAIGKVYQFTAGEKIHTEISRKYDDQILQSILQNTDFEIAEKFVDSKHYFADYILNRTISIKP
jgi:L-histidine Nalpha-methyltransferase